MEKWSERFVLGVTGLMGAGKTLACKIFEELGALRINADAIAKRYTDVDSPIKSELVGIFGPDVLDEREAPDRKYIAKIVFNHPEKLKQLNALIHPRVSREVAEIISSTYGGRVIAWEAPLLFEGRGHLICHATLTVYANLDLAYERAKERDGITREDFEARVRNQMDIKEKIRLSDFSIRNEFGIEYLRAECKKIYDIILSCREGQY